MNRREFLKYSASEVISLLLASSLFGYDQGFMKTLEEIVSGEMSDKKKEYLSKRLDETMEMATKFRGTHLATHSFPFEMKDGGGKINIQFECIQGKKGYGKGLRTLVYLDRESWRSLRRGIYSAWLVFFSTKETKISSKIYELNIDQHYGYVNYEPLKQRVIEGDYYIEKVKGGVFTILKKAKIKKKDINKIFFIKDVAKDIKQFKLDKQFTDIGNRITGDRVWKNEFYYDGYGFLDDILFEGRLRAPKVIDLEIMRGEDSIKGYAAIVEVVDYKNLYVLKKPVILKRIGGGKGAIAAPLPVKELMKKYGIKTQTEEESEEK